MRASDHQSLSHQPRECKRSGQGVINSTHFRPARQHEYSNHLEGALGFEFSALEFRFHSRLLSAARPQGLTAARQSTVSLDQLVRALTAAGGKIIVKTAKAKTKKGQIASRRKEELIFDVATSN